MTTEPPHTPEPEEPAGAAPAEPEEPAGAASPAPEEPAGEDPPPSGPAPRRLTRSSSDRLVGGVAGGLGRYFGVDPILFRIGFVVLSFAGGVGLIAYIGLLAFVPSDDGEPLGRSRTGNVAGLVVLALIAVVVLGPPVFFLAPVAVPVVILVLLGLLLWRAAGGAQGTDDPGRMVARAAIALLIGIAAVGAFLGVGFVAAIGGGVAMAILAVTAGVALVATAFVGGARWLIAPALILVLPVALVAALDLDLEGGLGQREYRPASASDVRPVYRLGAGELIVDLRDVDLPAGTTNLRVKLGVGHAVVCVPQGASVSSDVQVGAGYADVLDRATDGVDVAFAQGVTSASDAPQVHVDADIGVGALEVSDGTGPVVGHWDHGRQVLCP